MEKQNSQCEHGHPIERTRGLFCTGVRLRCGSLSIPPPVSPSNSFAGSDTGAVIDSEPHQSRTPVQNKPLVRSIGCPCSHWLCRFSGLHSNKPLIR